MTVSRRTVVAALGATALAPIRSAEAQTFPNRTIRIVVPFPAGGPTDILSRIVAQKMSEDWGQPVVIENRPGADTAIGAVQVAKAAPDGHTLLAAMDTTLVMNPATKTSLPYDPFKDFAPVGLAVTSCNILVARAGFKGDTLADVLSEAKARPGQLNYATQGLGSTGYLAGELLQTLAKVELTQVPYKGGAQVATSLLGGEVELAFLSVTALKSIGAGRIKALAVTCGKRDPGVPNVPTFAEAGVAGYDASFWYGLLAPAGTPNAIIGRLNQALRAALADTSVSQPLAALGLIAAPSSPQEFSAVIRRDYEKWRRTFAGRKASGR